MQQNQVLKKKQVLDTSNLAAKSDLMNLKAEEDKIDIAKLKTVLVDLSKLSNLVDSDIIKKLCTIN